MANKVVIVEAGTTSENLCFDKNETHPRGCGKSGDLVILSSKFEEKLPSMVIINSKLDGYLTMEKVIGEVSAHNKRHPDNVIHKLIFLRCGNVDSTKTKFESMSQSDVGTQVGVALVDLKPQYSTDVFCCVVNQFFDTPNESLKSIIERGLASVDFGYYGYDPKFVYLTVKL